MQGRAKPNPVSRFICFCFSQIVDSFPNFINKRVNNHVLRPRSQLYSFYKRVPPGSSLQHGDVVAQSHSFFFPSPHYQMICGVTWATWITKRGDKSSNASDPSERVVIHVLTRGCIFLIYFHCWL